MSQLKNKKLSLVKLGESSLKTVSHYDLKSDILTILNSTNGLNQLKTNHFYELLDTVCELAENSDYKASSENLKLDKKSIVMDSLFTVFPELNNDMHKNLIDQYIDHIIKKGLIKKIPSSTIISNSVSNFVVKKFL